MSLFDAYWSLHRRQARELAEWCGLPANDGAVAAVLASLTLAEALEARHAEFAATAALARELGHPRSEIMQSEFAIFDELAEAA